MRRIAMRTFILIAVWLSACLCLSSHQAWAQKSADVLHLEELKKPHEIDKVIGKGLAYLVKQQDPGDGHFRGDLPNTYTALACMALMASGQLPGQSLYGDNLQRGIMYLTRKSKQDKGYFGKEGNARMYGHGICTLALCEAYGMLETEEQNREVKNAIDRALKIILYSQSSKKDTRGGWRYEPRPTDSDLSVTVWQILALRSAKNCQLDVPQVAIDDAIDYVRRTYSQSKGGYSYLHNDNRATPAMKTAGVVALQALGAFEDEEDKRQMKESMSFLKDFNPRDGGHYYYQSYYLATAANMYSEETRTTFLPKLEKHLMSMQQDNGSWPKHSGHADGIYSTAFAVICLCVHYQYLPIYQE